MGVIYVHSDADQVSVEALRGALRFLGCDPAACAFFFPSNARHNLRGEESETFPRENLASPVPGSGLAILANDFVRAGGLAVGLPVTNVDSNLHHPAVKKATIEFFRLLGQGLPIIVLTREHLGNVFSSPLQGTDQREPRI